MNNSYINGKERWPRTLSAALNALVNWKGEKIPPAQKYGSREGVFMTTKGNLGGFRGDCYNSG